MTVATPASGPWSLYSPRQRRRFLAVIFLVGASSYIDKNIISVVLEPIKVEFAVSDTQLGLISGLAFAFVYAALGIPVATLADRGDRKQILTIALAVWSVMTAACGLTAGFWQLAAARFGVGAGEAGAIPPAQSLLADYFAPTERASAIGVFMMSSAAGYAIALILGGIIAQHWGWRATFLCGGLLGLLLVPLTHFGLREPRRQVDSGGRTLGERPIVALRALATKPSYCLMLASITVYFIMSYGAMVFVVSFLIRVHGLDVGEAGTMFGLVAAVSAVIGNLAGGWTADRLAARDQAWLPRISGLGLLVVTPLFQAAFLAPSKGLTLVCLSAAMLLLSAVIPAMFAGIHLVCGSARRALAVAIVFLCANLVGLGLGPIITGALSDWLGAHWTPANGLRYALVIVTAALVPAGLLMLRACRHISVDQEA